MAGCGCNGDFVRIALLSDRSHSPCSRVALDEPTAALLICRRTKNADVAQLVAHNLAKVGVAGSNPVVRSRRAEGAAAVDSVSWWAFIAGMVVGGQILLGLRWAFRSDRGRREPE